MNVFIMRVLGVFMGVGWCRRGLSGGLKRNEI